METTKITIEMTPSEAFDLAYALEFYIRKDTEAITNPVMFRFDDKEVERKLLQHFVSDGYTLNFNDAWGLPNTDYRDVDDWYKVLMTRRKKELSTLAKKKKPKQKTKQTVKNKRRL
jgi:hypothetical protein